MEQKKYEYEGKYVSNGWKSLIIQLQSEQSPDLAGGNCKTCDSDKNSRFIINHSR
jgi:hypothetical protein